VQQAYRALRILAEAQTVRLMVTPGPCALLLDELASACTALQSGSAGLTCVILDFGVSPRQAEAGIGLSQAGCRPGGGEAAKLRNEAERAAALVRAVPQPVLAVVRESLSEAASVLVRAADLVLIAREASFVAPVPVGGVRAPERLSGEQAMRLGQATWCTPARQLDRQLEEVLALLRRSSATALRQAKTAVRLALRSLPPVEGRSSSPWLEPGSFSLPLPTEDEDEEARCLRESRARLEALRRVNSFYLSEVSPSTDAQEGLRAFLEKRAPRWQDDQE
jgi:enoyl-CoA hydratase/carnithine racemase